MSALRPSMRGFMVSDWHWTLYGGIIFVLSLAHLYWTNTSKR